MEETEQIENLYFKVTPESDDRRLKREQRRILRRETQKK